MKLGLRTAALLGTLLAGAPAAARVVLFGVDGGSWPLIDRALAAGELPAFAALKARGVTAELETVEPVISPTVWSSIATGRSPEAHGITDFMRNRTHLRVPTVFERMAARGLRVGLYDYLVTWPPRPLPNGFVIPGWLRRDERVTPPDVFARAGVTPYSYAVDRFRSRESWRANARRELSEKPERWNRLADAFALDVGAVSFYALDTIGHRFWRAAFPAEFDEPPLPEEAAQPAGSGLRAWRSGSRPARSPPSEKRSRSRTSSWRRSCAWTRGRSRRASRCSARSRRGSNRRRRRPERPPSRWT